MGTLFPKKEELRRVWPFLGEYLRGGPSADGRIESVDKGLRVKSQVCCSGHAQDHPCWCSGVGRRTQKPVCQYQPAWVRTAAETQSIAPPPEEEGRMLAGWLPQRPERAEGTISNTAMSNRLDLAQTKGAKLPVSNEN